MRDEPRFLYPASPVDRALTARIARAVDARTKEFRQRVLPTLRIVRELHAATGRNRLAIAADVLDAWVRHGINPRSFAANMIWNVPVERRGDFVTSGEMEAFFAATIDPEDRALIRDKAAFADRARQSGIPWPATLAVVNRCEGPPIDGAVVVEAKDALVATLERVTAARDVFLKPSCGKQGRGVFRVMRGGRACDGDGVELALGELAERVFAYRHPAGAYGYLVQPALAPDPAVSEVTGVAGLSTMRVVTAVRDGTTHTLQAFVKVPAPGRLTDNFCNGVTGAMLAGLDLGAGRLTHLVGLLRAGNRFVLERSSTHPATGRRVDGRELPVLNRALALAHRAALLHPRTATLGWDIALTSSGCVFLDVNAMWSASGSQVCTGEGMRPTMARIFPEHWLRPARERA